jgi:hypothetical protein
MRLFASFLFGAKQSLKNLNSLDIVVEYLPAKMEGTVRVTVPSFYHWL